EQSILELESHPDDLELVQTIFRVVHTLKGNAGILELQRLLKFAHNLEDLLDAIRKQKNHVTTATTSVLLEALDLLRQMIAAAGKGKDFAPRNTPEVLSKITRLLKAGGRASKRKGQVSKRGIEESRSAPIDAGESLASLRDSAGTLRVDI